jgi:hypothetical protein
MECIGEVHARLKPVERGSNRIRLFGLNLRKPSDVPHALGHGRPVKGVAALRRLDP